MNVMSNTSACILTHHLTHQFGKDAPVVNQVNLEVPVGSIYGFLGPNGAGKTTTMRLLLGLLKKQQGTIQILGKPLDAHRVSIMQSVGTMIESPSVYAHLSARENLRILQHIYTCKPERIEAVLQITGIADTGTKPAGKFSLGMKQRLGIAMALLNEPQLLILDEPTNGLDPNGMIEIRELLHKLHQESGITIFVSSHLLSEIEKLATHTGIIHRGSMRFQGSMQALRQAQEKKAVTSILADNMVRAKEILNDMHILSETENNYITISGQAPENIIRLNKRLVEGGVGIMEITTRKHDLENIFMNLIQNEYATH